MSGTILAKSEFAIVVKNLTKRFSNSSSKVLRNSLLGIGSKAPKDFIALENISFNVKKGESVGILGVNGSGKSTLLQIIAGTLQPSLGSIAVNGKLCAILELGSGFNHDFSGRENIYLNASVLGFSFKKTQTKINDIIEFAEVGDFIDKPISTYSSGMTMRLAFAVQVFLEPEILIIDEALSVGDHFFKKKCNERISYLKEKGMTFIFVTHNEETLRILADRTIFIDKGKLIKDSDTNSCINAYLKEKNKKFHFLNTKDYSKRKYLEKIENEDIKILEFKIINDNKKDYFEKNEIIKFFAKFRIQSYYTNLYVGIRIRNKEGYKIYSKPFLLHNSKNQNCDKDLEIILENEFSFVCHFADNMYFVEVMINQKKRHFFFEKKTLIRIKDIVYFNVKNKDNDKIGGIVDLNLKIKSKK